MQFKHFIADYPLQGKYMLGKFKPHGWVLPLAAHCGVHFLFTFAIAYLWTFNGLLALGCGLLDFVVHFIMDRVKASLRACLSQCPCYTKLRSLLIRLIWKVRRPLSLIESISVLKVTHISGMR